MARANYRALENAAANPAKLPERLEKDRRKELAAFGESQRGKLARDMLHYLTLGVVTNRVPRSDENEARLDRDRRTEALVRYLREVADSGVDPEVSYDAAQIRNSMDQLASLLEDVSSKRMHNRAVAVIGKLQSESRNDALRADCARLLTAMSAGKSAEVTAANDKVPKASVMLPSAISGKAALQAR